MSLSKPTKQPIIPSTSLSTVQPVTLSTRPPSNQSTIWYSDLKKISPCLHVNHKPTFNLILKNVCMLTKILYCQPINKYANSLCSQKWMCLYEVVVVVVEVLSVEIPCMCRLLIYTDNVFPLFWISTNLYRQWFSP